MTEKTLKPKTSSRNVNGTGSRSSVAMGFGMSGKPPASAPKVTPKKEKGFSRIAPWKIILTTILIGIGGYFYLTHLFATQEIYQEVRQLEQEYETARRVYDERRLMYERMTGPARIYSRAGELGFIHGSAGDTVIEID